MKTAIKVLNILTMVGCIIGAVVMLLYGCVLEDAFSEIEIQGAGSTIGVILALLMAIPAIVCGIANSKLSKAQFKSDLVGIAIVTLIFGNLISGILMLTINDNDL